MKICIPVISFTKAGGMKVLTQLANRSVKLGHEVTFFCADVESKPYYKVDTEVSISYAPDSNKNSKEKSIIKKLYYIYNFLKINSKKYDAVLANYYLTAYPVYAGSRTKNFYYIQAYEPEFADEITNKIKKTTAKTIAWLSYYLPLIQIVNSKFYVGYKNINSKIILVPGLDLNIFKNTPRVKNKILTVGCIGRTETWKGSQDVADAIKIINDKNIPIKLRVAFNPVDHEYYERCEPIGSDGLADFYRSLDILVAPGHIQLGAIHYPVIEAMACGVTVITTGYYPANNGNSYIVPIASPESIADVILKMNEDDMSQKIKNAHADVQEFPWSKVVKKFIEIIEVNR